MSTVTQMTIGDGAAAADSKVANVLRTLKSTLLSLNIPTGPENDNEAQQAPPDDYAFLSSIISEPILNIVEAWYKYHYADLQGVGSGSVAPSQPEADVTLVSEIRSSERAKDQQLMDLNSLRVEKPHLEILFVQCGDTLGTVDAEEDGPGGGERKSAGAQKRPQARAQSRANKYPLRSLDRARSAKSPPRKKPRNSPEFDAFVKTLEVNRSICEWDFQLVQHLDIASLCQLGRAAGYLEIKGLIEVAAKVVQQKLIGQYSTDQLFKAYNIMLMQTNSSTLGQATSGAKCN